MEMILKNGFCEIPQNEMREVDGGAMWEWAVGAAAYNEIYDLGYKIGSWFR